MQASSIERRAAMLGRAGVLAAAVLAAACGDDTPPQDPVMPDAGPGEPLDAAPLDAAPPYGPRIIVSAAALTINEGTEVTFIVTVSDPPNGARTAVVSSSNQTAIAVSPTTFDFNAADFNRARSLTITAPDDANEDNETVTLTLSTPNDLEIRSATVTVSVIDDDALNIRAEPTTLVGAEDGAVEFGVRLTAQPSADVTVNVASGDTGTATVAPATLTFTQDNYDQAQTVTVTGVGDDDASADDVIVTLSSAGLASVAVLVTVNDADRLTIQTSVDSLTVAEGDTESFTVRLSHDPLGPVTVDIVNDDFGDPGDEALAQPMFLNFDSSNYSQPQTVTIRGLPDDDTDDETNSLTLYILYLTDITMMITVEDVTTAAASGARAR
jgi:hypothetical protein